MNLTKNIVTLKSRLSSQLFLDNRKIQFHPAVQLYAWMSLALITYTVNDFVLMTMAAFLLLLALGLNSARLLNLLRRTRWILISILLIYGYTTPGEPVWEQLGMFSPVSAGILHGMDQLLRLLTVLAGLSILVFSLTQAQLISGMYSLLFPVRLLGLSRERVAARLALTLTYAESALHNKTDNWTEYLEYHHPAGADKQSSIELHHAPPRYRDLVLLAAATAVTVGVWF